MIIKGKSQKAVMKAVSEFPDSSSSEIAELVTTAGRRMSRSAVRRCLADLGKMDMVENYESTQKVEQRCRRYNLTESGQEWEKYGQQSESAPINAIAGSLGLRQRQILRLSGRESKLVSREEIRDRLGLAAQTSRLAISSLIRLELLKSGDDVELSSRGKIWWISDRVQRGLKIKPDHMSKLWMEWK